MAKFLDAIGCDYFAPGQEFFRTTNAGGRFPALPMERNHTGYHINCNYDGTVDMIRLEAGQDGWTDLGGKGAYDVRAGR
jgi:hypothetical protein